MIRVYQANPGRGRKRMGQDPIAARAGRLRRHRLFQVIGEAATQELLGAAEILDLPARALVVEQGAPADSLFLVLSGRVRLKIGDEGAGPNTMAVLGPGEVIGLGAAAGGQPHALGAEALEACRVLRLDGATFRRLLDQRFDLTGFVLAAMSRRLCGLLRQLTDLKMKTGGQRVAGYLLGLTDAAEGPAEVRLPYDKRIIAETLGMRPETFSRALAKLRGLGVCRAGNTRIRVDDVARLRDYCHADAGEAPDDGIDGDAEGPATFAR